MSKPSWDDAPQWAQYLAQGSDGWWSWFEVMPNTAYRGEWGHEGYAGRSLSAAKAEPIPGWFDTLERRP